MKRILYGLLGVLLLSGTLLSGSYGLSQANKDIYNDALALQSQVDALGFENFTLSDYKVRFFDGTTDYVIFNDTITKETAVMNTFVGTSIKVEGEYQVLLPTVENFSELFTLLEGTTQLADSKTNFETQVYDSANHIATLWHEALHAYQLTNYSSQIMTGVDTISTDRFEEIIVKTVNANENVVKLDQRAIALLYDAYEADTTAQKEALLTQYLELETKRRALLNDEACRVEDYYEVSEGTARYMESAVYRLQAGDDAFSQRYLTRGDYEKGSGRYYTVGMLKCYLLDQLFPNWKAGYDFSTTLTEELYAISNTGS